VENTTEHVAIHWPGERPHDWAEWETVIRAVLRQAGVGPWDVVMEQQGQMWRVAGAVTRGGPRNDVADNKRRHRVTETLRAQGKPAGLRSDAPPPIPHEKPPGLREP
jgi:hypothetical protein